MVSVLTPVEVLIAARRPHLAAVTGIVHHEDLWQLCRDELTGLDVRTDRWGYPRPLVRRRCQDRAPARELRRCETIPWRVIAAQIAPGVRRGSR